MHRVENDCVGCDLPCLGVDRCPLANIDRHYCDTKGCEEPATCCIDGEDFCEEHARQYLTDIFNDFTTQEQAEMLKWSYKEYN